MKYLYLLILFFFFSSNLFSQTNYSEFIKLKRLFIEEKYSIISGYDHQIDKKNEFYPYAVFYKGVSEYKLSSYDKSENYFKEIITIYPNWSQIDEVYYWQIKVDLKTNNFDNALINFSELNNSEIKEILYPDIDPFLENISSSKLYHYYELYPKNKSVAKYYGRFLLKEYLDSSVIEEINKILKIVESENLFISKKSNFKIAVLLPFMFEGIENNTFIKKNDFIMDLYTGINYGFKNNDSISTNIEILSFDTKRNPDTIKKLIEDGSLDNVDLIIGPLYSKPIEIVKQFCLEKKVLMINPLSSNNKIIDDNNYSFLFKPSINTIAKQTADYSINNFSKNKNVLIFYENNYQDSLIASLYKQKLDSSNFNIIYSKSVSFEDSRLILDSLASTYEYILSDSLFDTLSNVPKIVIKEGRGIDKLDTTYMYTEKFFIEDDSIGHIFVSSKILYLLQMQLVH